LELAASLAGRTAYTPLIRLSVQCVDRVACLPQAGTVSAVYQQIYIIFNLPIALVFSCLIFALHAYNVGDAYYIRTSIDVVWV